MTWHHYPSWGRQEDVTHHQIFGKKQKYPLNNSSSSPLQVLHTGAKKYSSAKIWRSPTLSPFPPLPPFPPKIPNLRDSIRRHQITISAFHSLLELICPRKGQVQDFTFFMSAQSFVSGFLGFSSYISEESSLGLLATVCSSIVQLITYLFLF